ncbi:MAG: YgfZ/GcvT domain-containing protein [Gammaproteobacteria bacterium]
MSQIRATDSLAQLLAPAPNEFDANGTVHSSDRIMESRAALEASVVTALADASFVRLDGEDVVSFLQGQLTADVRLVDEGHSTLAAWLNPKGRVQTLMRLFDRDGALHMMLPRAFADQTVKRLRMFVLRAKVTLTPVDDNLAAMGVAGDEAARLLRDAGAALPEASDESATSAGCTFVLLHGKRPRYLVIGPVDALEPFARALSGHASTVGAAAWRLLDIEAGVPDIEPGAENTYLPQMLNLQALGGVNFDKGCYVGQEIVARTQYLGRLKRRLYRASVGPGANLEAGAPIYANGSEQSAGAVLSTAERPDGRLACLAVIQIDAAGMPLSVGAVDGDRLELEALPYALETS